MEVNVPYAENPSRTADSRNIAAVSVIDQYFQNIAKECLHDDLRDDVF